MKLILIDILLSSLKIIRTLRLFNTREYTKYNCSDEEFMLNTSALYTTNGNNDKNFNLELINYAFYLPLFFPSGCWTSWKAQRIWGPWSTRPLYTSILCRPPKMFKCWIHVQSNLDYPDSSGPRLLVWIIESPDNRKNWILMRYKCK